MKIIHVVGSMVTGGAETVVATLCRLHRKQGHEPSVQALGVGGRLSLELKQEGIPVTIHQEFSRRSVGYRIRSLCRMFNAERPDVIHCHSPGPIILGALGARLAGFRAVVATRHDQARDPLPFRHQILFRMAASLCYRVVAVSPEATENLTRRLGLQSARLMTILNGAAPAATGDLLAVDAINEGFNLVTVGRLVKCKDQGRILEAVAIARQEVPHLRLNIVGAGEEETNLRRLCAELGLEGQVEFLGERPDVGRWLRQADLFVMSSLTEGLPLALLEALAAGTPQVVTEVGGMPDVVKTADSGLVVPPSRPDLLARAIVSIASSPEVRRRFAENAKKAYAACFSPEIYAQKYLDLYEKCAEETRR